MDHLTPTAQLTSTRPSFFEVYAAQHLNTALRPAIRFIIDIISLRHPLLRPLSNWADESFTLLLLLIETAQLSQHSSLLSESFYALRRTASPTLSSSPANSILTPPQIALALFLDVVCPHINAKLDAVHSTATGGAAADLFDSNSINAPSIPPEFSGSFPAPNSGTSVNTSSPARVHIPHWVSLLQRLLSSPKQALAAAKALYTYMRTARFRALLLRYYPAVKSLIEACNMLLGMLYLYGYTPYFSLSLLIQRLALRRDSQLDFLRVAISNKLYTPSRLHGLKVATLRLLSLLKTGFLASIFAFRFLQYYYSAEASAPRDVGPSLPPPEPLHPAEGVDSRAAQAPGMCPICQQMRVNPTACVTSGYVFCYLCIVPHVQMMSCCPITLAPTAVDDLVRVYEEDAAM